MQVVQHCFYLERIIGSLLAFVGVSPSAVLVVASASRNISLENLLSNDLCLSASVSMRQAVQHCSTELLELGHAVA